MERKILITSGHVYIYLGSAYWAGLTYATAVACNFQERCKGAEWVPRIHDRMELNAVLTEKLKNEGVI